MNEPDHLGKYLIQGILGEGGMGIVYKGYDPQLARPVAIKTIRKGLLKGKAGQELKTRFSREAKAEGSLIHPNIVAVYEFQEDEEGMPFFVMEYVDGKSLKEFLSRGMHFNLEMTLHIIGQVLSALAYSHKHGVIHRDIKPANILWCEDDTIKIADFGIAKMEESEYTRTGQVMGTPQYFSPEQALGLKTDGRSDLYSTALVLYELLSGQKPFAGVPVTEVRGLTSEHYSKLDIEDPQILASFKDMMVKALAREPAKRFQSAEEFIAPIKQINALNEASKEQPELTSGKGSRYGWIGAGSLLGVLLLVGAFFLGELSRREPAPAEPSSRQEDKGVVPEPAKQEPETKPSDEREETPARQVSLTDAQQKKLARLLKAGDLHLLVGRYISPPGSNAYHSFKLALDLDPENVQAQEGMAAIQEKVFLQSQQMIRDGRIDDAINSLAMATRLFPENQELRSLQGRVTP